MDSYQQRKAARKEYYLHYVYGGKERTYTACNGSGYYDHSGSPVCGSCDGTGKERYKPSTNDNEKE